MSKHDRIEEEAARWLLREDGESWNETTAMERDVWLDAEMAHKVAYWRLKAAWGQAGRLAALRSVTPPIHPSGWALRNFRSVAAAIVILGIGVGGALWWRDNTIGLVETPVGGHQTIRLADGSVLELNTNTRVQVQDDGVARRVKLEQGEAYFQVRHDPKHPFVVIAGNHRITDLGTKFTVRMDGEDVAVMVQEGRVKVETLDNPAGAAPVEMHQDAQLVATAETTLVTPRSEQQIADALSWRKGMLVFNNRTLSEVAEEFNRYNDRKIVISDNDVASTRIAGSFQANNLPAFVRLLQKAFGFHVEESDTTVKVSQ